MIECSERFRKGGYHATAKLREAKFSLPPPMLEQLRREAEEKDLTMSQVLRQYLRFGGLGQHQDGVDLKREEGSDDNGS